ncbi:MAG: thiolase family protein, partial [Trueperaceae bacterium]
MSGRASARPRARDAVIVSAVRTPTGKGRAPRPDRPGGALSVWHPVDLLAFAMRGALARIDLDPGGVAPDGGTDRLEGVLDDALIGCVTQAGEQSFNVARNAVLAAGLPESLPAATIDRQCGSSQQAMAFAAQAIRAGDQDAVLVAGIESMSRAPMGSAAGGRDPFGSGVAERYPGGLVPQGIAAERIAARWDLSRDELDAWAVRSHRRAGDAARSGALAGELVPVPVAGEAGTTVLDHDEGVRPDAVLAGLSGLKPAFYDPAWEVRFPEVRWVVHAGNASQLADGAAAAVVVSAGGGGG